MGGVIKILVAKMGGGGVVAILLTPIFVGLNLGPPPEESDSYLCKPGIAAVVGNLLSHIVYPSQLEWCLLKVGPTGVGWGSCVTVGRWV